MDVPPIIMYSDPALIDTIVGELKSQGTFDQFRKECIADVDTKVCTRINEPISAIITLQSWIGMSRHPTGST